MLDFEDPRAAALGDAELFVPVFAHLIRHDERGAFLVDAGLDRSFAEATSGDMRGPLRASSTPCRSPAKDVVSRIHVEHIELTGIGHEL